MNSTKTLKVAAAAFLLSLSACAPKAPSHVADTIFYGGPIVTVNEKQPEVSALAVRDGSILAVGDAAEIVKTHSGDATRMVDLKGRTLMPGFVEPPFTYPSRQSPRTLRSISQTFRCRTTQWTQSSASFARTKTLYRKGVGFWRSALNPHERYL